MMRGSIRHLMLALFASAMLLPAMLAAASDDAAANETRDTAAPLRHSPWLALRFEQGGKQVPLIRGETLKTSVRLKKRPFTIVLPVRGDDDVYRIAVWNDPSIFKKIINKPRRIEMPSYFGAGTGMADTDAGSGRLMLNQYGHHYLEGLRLGPELDRHTFNVSSVLADDEDGESRDTPIRKVDGPLYLVAWFDKNGDKAVNYGEYEYLILNFR